MNESMILSAGLAVLSYDEDNIKDHIDYLFRYSKIANKSPDYKFSTDEGKHGYYFYGIVTDRTTSTAYPFVRGTDGDDPIGKLKSWLTNLNIRTGSNDIQNGFEDEGNRWFERYKTILYRVTNIWTSGQSQGAAVQQYIAKLCYENLSDDKQIFSLGISVPPWCREDTLKVIDGFDKDRFRAVAYYHNMDPVCGTDIYSAAKACRIGEWIKLNCPDRYGVKGVNPVTHSCKMYIASLIIYGIKHRIFDHDGIDTLIGIYERCVN